MTKECSYLRNGLEICGGNMKTKIGLYAGSFKPFHVGHLDIVEQAKLVFDEVIVARGINPEKIDDGQEYPFPLNTLTVMSIGVLRFDGLLIDEINRFELAGKDITLVRGLRSGADLEYEQNFAAFMKSMKPDVKIVAFYCNPQYRHINSTALRGIRKFSEAEYDKYVVK